MKVILPDRPYQLLFEHRPCCLYVYIGSERHDLEIATRYWVEILSLLHRRRYTCVLIEQDISQPLPVHDIFTLVSRLAYSGHSDVSFAICDRYYDAKRCEFEQLVGMNRGLNLKIFGTMAEAEAWLSEQGPGRSAIRVAGENGKRNAFTGNAVRHAA